MNEKFRFYYGIIPDLINGELTIDKIDNIMSDDEDNKHCVIKKKIILINQLIKH